MDWIKEQVDKHGLFNKEPEAQKIDQKPTTNIKILSGGDSETEIYTQTYQLQTFDSNEKKDKNPQTTDSNVNPQTKEQ